MAFELHPQLLQDCHPLGCFQDCHILLHRNSSLPWYILVPETDVGELHELTTPERHRLDALLTSMALFLKNHHRSEHTNVAAIGNRVPQLHVHIVGRHKDDACWPDVVWGNLPPAGERDPDSVDLLRGQLMKFLEANCSDGGNPHDTQGIGTNR